MMHNIKHSLYILSLSYEGKQKKMAMEINLSNEKRKKISG